MKISSNSAMVKFGREFGVKLHGGEVIELIGDVGVGKTTFVKGLALGLGVTDTVNSPSFSISKVYNGNINGKPVYLRHYDFYRLDEAGIMRDELAENLRDPQTITVIEWAKTVAGVLPADRIRVEIKYLPHGDAREVICS